MRKDHDEIPQIKPDSVLDPQQIKLTEVETHSGAVEFGKQPTFIKKMKFKLPKFNLKIPIFKGKKIYKVSMMVLGVFLILAFVFIIIPGIFLFRDFVEFKGSMARLSSSFNSQDISIVKAELGAVEEKLNNLRISYSRFIWGRYVPFVGVYYRDGEAAVSAGTHALDALDIVIETMEPYADIIGFGGVDSNTTDSANDRIEFLVETIGGILPRADEVTEKAKVTRGELVKVNPSRYPEKLFGREIRATLKRYLTAAEEIADFVANSKPLLESTPYLLGTDDTRTYLLLFQNDKELRPTGGFITAYSVIEVTNGKVQPVSSNDIYNLDKDYNPSVEAPSILRKYLKGPYLISRNYRLRDMNWNPDFRGSMELFIPEAEKAGVEDIDGVIAVDTQVVVNILNAIGPVDVPGYGQYSTNHDERCACPQVIYELESFADVEGPIVWSENEPGKIVFAPENYLNRKEIVGPLMNTILANALGQPKEKLPDLFLAAWRSLTEKHVLFYMFDGKAQDGVEAFGIAGRVKDYTGDYIQVVDANLGGRKSNLYVTQEVSQIVEVAGDGTITKTVDITYQNPQDYDGWLNSVLPNWTRIYIPKGSEVIDIQGFEDPGEVYEEFGKTVVSGGFELRPKGIKKITLVYKLPFKSEGEYELLIQKQPGLDAPLYTINVGRRTEEFYLRTDREFKFEI
jgi:hypothetical protein